MRYITLLFILLTFTACSRIYHSGVIYDRDSAYLSAKNTPPLKVPPGLSSSSIHEEYPVPQRDYPESAKKVSLVPPGLT